MDLRIADGPGFVAFVHRIVSKQGKPLLNAGASTVVRLEDGRIFYHRRHPVRVGGPFQSVEHLIRSEGVRRFPEAGNPDELGYEVFEWEGGFFRIESGAAQDIRQYRDLEQATRGAASKANGATTAASAEIRSKPVSALPALVAHADWGSDPKKRWMCVAALGAHGTYRVDLPEPVGEASTLLRRLRDRADGGNAVVGFDFPIGVPARYAEKVGIDSFPAFLSKLGSDGWGEFYHVAARRQEIGLRRPFYPKRSVAKGEVAQRDLLDALGVQSIDQLLRTCDRPTATRRAACSIFWTIGGNQVGKAAIIGWRDVLTPALNDTDMDVGLWPFEGPLDELVRRRQIVIVETYPAEACTHLGLTPPGSGWSKRSQDGRRAQAYKLREWTSRRPVALATDLTATLDDGFGPSKGAEDPFDALLGLLSMLEVLMGYRAEGSATGGHAKVEGWILGQVPGGPT